MIPNGDRNPFQGTFTQFHFMENPYRMNMGDSVLRCPKKNTNLRVMCFSQKSLRNGESIGDMSEFTALKEKLSCAPFTSAVAIFREFFFFFGKQHGMIGRFFQNCKKWGPKMI